VITRGAADVTIKKRGDASALDTESSSLQQQRDRGTVSLSDANAFLTRRERRNKVLARVIVRHAMAALQAIDKELSQLPTESPALPPKAGPAPGAGPSTRQPSLLTVSDLSKRLNLAKATVYKPTSARQIDHYRLGGRVLFAEKQVEAYLTAREQHRIGATPRNRER